MAVVSRMSKASGCTRAPWVATSCSRRSRRRPVATTCQPPVMKRATAAAPKPELAADRMVCVSTYSSAGRASADGGGSAGSAGGRPPARARARPWIDSRSRRATAAPSRVGDARALPRRVLRGLGGRRPCHGRALSRGASYHSRQHHVLGQDRRLGERDARLVAVSSGLACSPGIPSRSAARRAWLMSSACGTATAGVGLRFDQWASCHGAPLADSLPRGFSPS